MAEYVLKMQAQQPGLQLEIKDIEDRTAPLWVCCSHSQ